MIGYAAEELFAVGFLRAAGYPEDQARAMAKRIMDPFLDERLLTLSERIMKEKVLGGMRMMSGVIR